jgi:hypothetical protein
MSLGALFWGGRFFQLTILGALIMTTVNYVSKTELPHYLNTSNLDPDAQNAIIRQLIHDGLYTKGPGPGPDIWVESDIKNGTPQPPLFDSIGHPKPPGFVLARSRGPERHGENRRGPKSHCR